MEYYVSKREYNNYFISQINNWLAKLSNKELIEVYNEEARRGLTGVHQQTLLLYALNQAFEKRYYSSPIFLNHNSLGIGIEMVNWVTEIPEDPVEPLIGYFQGLTFIDTIKMDVSYISLIIRVKSINRHIGCLQYFFESYCPFGKTNGSLLILNEMNDPPHWLIEFTENTLKPLGLKDKRDYIFAEEKLILDKDLFTDPLLNQSHPCCVDIPWLNSIITRKANYFWHV